MKFRVSFSKNGTEIPYFDPECDAAERHEYVDLRANPEAVDLLPEVEWCPELKSLLLTINQDDSIFQTFGCNFTFGADDMDEMDSDEPSDAVGADEGLTNGDATITSYIHVGFADLDRCQCLDDYYRLCGRIGRFLSNQFDAQTDEPELNDFPIEFCFEYLRINGEDKGKVLSIICDVAGQSGEQAISNWSRIMNMIAGFLAAERLN